MHGYIYKQQIKLQIFWTSQPKTRASLKGEHFNRSCPSHQRSKIFFHIRQILHFSFDAGQRPLSEGKIKNKKTYKFYFSADLTRAAAQCTKGLAPAMVQGTHEIRRGSTHACPSWFLGLLRLPKFNYLGVMVGLDGWIGWGVQVLARSMT